jgi:hypothetical protein
MAEGQLRARLKPGSWNVFVLAPPPTNERMNTKTLPTLDEEDLRQVRQIFEWVRIGAVTPIASLLQQGLPANLLNEKGDSLLMLAAYHGHPELVKLLLQAGADPELRNDRGQTPLAGAVFKGDVATVQVLLEHGAAVDGRMADGKTPLMMAAMFNRIEMLELLAGRGAQLQAQDASGADAMEAATRMGAHEAVAWLVERRTP